MSLARSLLHDLRPFFRLLEEPVSRSPAYFAHPARSIFDDPFFQAPGHLRPAVDLSEEGNNYIVEAELPGVRKEDVNVSIGEGGRSLTIEGSVARRSAAPTQATAPVQAATPEAAGDATIVAATTSEGPASAEVSQPAHQANQLSNERVFTSNATFTRTVHLPRQVDGSRVTAKLTNGILTLTLPKAEDNASVKVEVL